MSASGSRLAPPAARLVASGRSLPRRVRAAPLPAVATALARDVARSFRSHAHFASRPRRWPSLRPLAERHRLCSAAAAAPPEDTYDASATYDAVVVVAGGMTDDGGLPAWVVNRLDRAAEEYERHRDAAPATPGSPAPTYILLSGSATPHKPPPLAKGGFTLHESSAMAEYLVERRGVPPEHLLKDTASMDTIGNAYFTLVQHAIPRGWRSALIITSAFHMPRIRAAFEWVWGLSEPRDAVALAFLSVPDEGVAPDVADARRAREAKSEAALRENQARVTDLPAFAEWLYTTHLCYAVARQHEIGEFAEMKNDPAMKSY